MAEDLPDHYFRVRENGAVAFRVQTDSRNRRIDLVEIATLNTRNGSVKPKPGRDLTEADEQAIADWLATRQRLAAEREIDDIFRAIDHLNLTAQWAQSRATPEALEKVTDALLLAMHDLRNVLVRKKADRLSGKPAD